ncbi:MAG: hypothetical protein KR126chlam1_00179 [Chlamydiae bacterium]|nr:hypothetical protein [Chlamydiota bacterium]
MQVTLPDADVLVLYGVPSQELESLLREWLAESDERYAVVLEDDERALLGLTTHERIRYCFAENEEALKKVSWELVFLSFAFLEFPGNSQKDPSKMNAFYGHLEFILKGVHLVASDFFKQGVDRLDNFLQNGSRAKEMRDGRELFGKFEGVPAVICGAGPSLEEDIEFLREAQESALIFAGGTALSALSKLGITPHFGGMVDPHPPSERYKEGKSLQIPTFFQMRVHPDHLGEELLWMPGQENDLFENESFDGGWNSATFLTSISYRLGCNPIILVGVDLAQQKGRVYAAGLERPEGGDWIEVGKDGLLTTRDWLFAADWLSQIAEGAPVVTWINRSKGLEIEGFATSGGDLPEKRDLAPVVKQALSGIERGISLPIAPAEIEQSIARVGELVAEILALLETLFPQSPNLNGEYALLKREIENTLAYEQFFAPVWEVWKYPVARQVPKGVPEGYGLEVHKWLLIKGICDGRSV